MSEASRERPQTSQTERRSSENITRPAATTVGAAANAATLSKIGEQAFQRGELISAELTALTYGALVRQLFMEYAHPQQVNEQLERIGYNIGLRLVDDFLARSAAPPCRSFPATAEIIARVAFRMYLGVNAKVANMAPDGSGYSILFDFNPLAEFVELPEPMTGSLWYSNAICGVIRGALEMVQYAVQVHFERDVLRGDDCNEIRVSLIREMEEQVPTDNEI
jgi:hypothetical protein